MEVVFVEARGFTAALSDYFGSDDSYRSFQAELLRNPTAGPVMPGCGGLRKVRWPDRRRGKGKRSGLRVIYLYVPEVARIALIDVYDKDETENLSVQEQHALSTLAAAIRDEMLMRRKMP